MPDLTRHSYEISDRNVSYWIVDLAGKKGFIPFPPKNAWTVVGQGYITTEFKAMSQDEVQRKRAICGPYNWYYRYQENIFCASQSNISLADLENRRSTQESCRALLFQQNDPIEGRRRPENGYNTYGSGDRRSIRTQVYYRHSLHAKQNTLSSVYNASDHNYHFTFEYRKPHEVEVYLNGGRGPSNWTDCYLRPIRYDLGELPHGFMLPEVEGMKSFDPTIVITTMVSTTARSTVAITTTPEPTSIVGATTTTEADSATTLTVGTSSATSVDSSNSTEKQHVTSPSSVTKQASSHSTETEHITTSTEAGHVTSATIASQESTTKRSNYSADEMALIITFAAILASYVAVIVVGILFWRHVKKLREATSATSATEVSNSNVESGLQQRDSKQSIRTQATQNASLMEAPPNTAVEILTRRSSVLQATEKPSLFEAPTQMKSVVEMPVQQTLSVPQAVQKSSKAKLA
ncbi:hypothetical protein L596_010192 [Steinernema carpocapsae]|uniref:Uncharacterized protein n=1 Tax=Steinernema carpocapsae TaxID=34508 RepID=A0A4U5PHL8_STECR|nr:hypothetical protein L596_010192 [Steinernema carpocapsae]